MYESIFFAVELVDLQGKIYRLATLHEEQLIKL